ncbi:unnamed protein product [Protopolystoma xenopodis]|uniref:Ferritin n=1 Tax=Protopolystoma xenopodis TaxID=117903 RepID=A0A448WHN8_9PLAT|nr:unnamed protein product [Protopolystoma xenopodis]
MESRTNYSHDMEKSITTGINMHLSGEQAYNCMASICMSDNVSMPYFSEFLRLCGVRMRQTAESLIEYQAIRGGQWQLPESMKPLVSVPIMSHNEKDINGLICHLIELGLEMERKTEQYLRDLCQVATGKQDIETVGYIQKSLLRRQRFIIKVMVTHQTGLNLSQNAWLYCNMVIRPFLNQVKECMRTNSHHFSSHSSTQMVRNTTNSQSSSDRDNKSMDSENSIERLFLQSFSN